MPKSPERRQYMSGVKEYEKQHARRSAGDLLHVRIQGNFKQVRAGRSGKAIRIAPEKPQTA